MTPKRLLTYAIVGVAVVLIGWSLARWFGGRDALRDAEMAGLRATADSLQERRTADSARFVRQLAAAEASVDSADARYARSDALRRRLVLVAARPRDTLADSRDTVFRGDGPGGPNPDTVAVDVRVIALVAALDSTVDQQRRAIARQALALSTASSSLAVADSLLSNRARQIAVLERMVPSRRWRTLERAALVGGAGYVGWRVGLAARR